uniref:Rhodopsin n=1 Tax=Synedra hyperborea TaxID=265534 RepID=A0AA49QB36_9STRA|nr:rhodopsin [Synedra hyperborea]
MASITATQFNLVYDVLSFSLATMGATTIFLWMRVSSAAERYKSALIISGLVTFIAAYHYLRIFNSWTEAFEWTKDGTVQATGIPFNDAYRYMDWLLTVPLLLIEIVLVMNLPDDEIFSKASKLGVASALMIILGYPGELVLDENHLGTRWFYWFAAMIPFVYIVYTLLIGLADATNSETDLTVRKLTKGVQWLTVISWCTYPIVYVFPMLGIARDDIVVYIQLGYSVSDIISKCGVGLMIYRISMAKSVALRRGSEQTPLLA